MVIVWQSIVEAFTRLTHGHHSSNVKVITSRITQLVQKEKMLVPVAFIIGTAGSGKSLFTAAFSEWLKMSKQDVAVVNLDPGVLKLPYSPDVDVRNYVDVGDLMEKYGLGPNGALIMAADLIADEIETLQKTLKALTPTSFWWIRLGKWSCLRLEQVVLT